MQEQNKIICCRWAPTLGRLESAHEEIWGTKAHDPATDSELPCVFFGLYGLPDFYTLWRHKGKRWILWAGTDITHFLNGYWLDNLGRIKLFPQPFAGWISENCESWVENKVEYEALKTIGIESQICPSFLGNVNNFQLSFERNNPARFYTSVSGDNFKLYGWDRIPKLVEENPDIEFHCYGNSGSVPAITTTFISLHKNVFFHGRIPKEQMNEEIKKMTGALRLTKFDGFSEILAKSILWGQWPVSLIKYPYIFGLSKLRIAAKKKKPNLRGREYYARQLNRFPWNVKIKE